MNPHWRTDKVKGSTTLAAWRLEDIDSTEYGVVNLKGTYDVDDVCVVGFGNKWLCAANWRSMDTEDSSIDFFMEDDNVEHFELGWCPEEAYESMIKEAVDRVDDAKFWIEQYEQDTWIHGIIEKL